MSTLAQIARTFGGLSLISIGGANATVPEIHRQIVVGLHWMSDATFAKLVAIGQTAPGPNVLVVSIIGWSLAGIAGLLAATFAFLAPAGLLAIATGRLMERYAALDAIARIRRALAPVAIGFMLASAIVMTRASFSGALSLVIVAAVAWLVYATRVTPVWGILAGALVSATAHLIGAA